VKTAQGTLPSVFWPAVHHEVWSSGEFNPSKTTIDVRDGHAFDARTDIPPGGTTFKLLRRHDESGVSGTGFVLEGIVFTDGSCVVRWCTDTADQSWTVYGIENGKSGWHRFIDIHVQSHHNDVRIEFVNGRQEWTWEQAVPIEEERQRYYDRLEKSLVEWVRYHEGPMPTILTEFRRFIMPRTTAYQKVVEEIIEEQGTQVILEAVLRMVERERKGQD
jgi:hypothetical protein